MKISKHYQLKTDKAILFNAWISENTTIAPVVKIEVEPRVSGVFVLHAQMGDEIRLMQGEFLEIVPYESLKYTWNWQGEEEITTVSVVFTENQQGTDVHLIHTGFETRESRDLHDQGWDHYLKELAKKLEG